MLSRLVHIPRSLLHVGLDDLPGFGVNESARVALRALLADLPEVPDAASSAQLVGPPRVTLPCLAVVARHVGQGLRDRNLAIAHDLRRLRAERHKLLFVTAQALDDALAQGDERPSRETVLFVSDVLPASLVLLTSRETVGLASFVTAPEPVSELAHWRVVNLDA